MNEKKTIHRYIVKIYMLENLWKWKNNNIWNKKETNANFERIERVVSFFEKFVSWGFPFETLVCQSDGVYRGR